MAAPNTHAMALQAGLRTLHEIGPELKRAISGTLDPGFVLESEEPQHRVNFRGESWAPRSLGAEKLSFHS